MNKVTGSFSVDDIAAAKTSIADYVDAAYEIGTPTQMTIHIELRINADDDTNYFQFSFAMTIHVYASSSVHDKAGVNIDAVLDEWNDCVSDSGKYDDIDSGNIDGTVTIVVAE